MLDNPTEIAVKLKRLREKNPGITNKYLADAARVSPQAVSQWFKTGKLSKKSLAAVMLAYGVGPDLDRANAGGVHDGNLLEYRNQNSVPAKYARLPRDAQTHIEALIDILLAK